MKRIKMQIYQYIFDMEINDQDVVVASSFKVEGFPTGVITSSFKVEGFPTGVITDEQMREGQKYQQEIHAGEWLWLIEKEGEIKLPTHDITLHLVNPQYNGAYKFGGGNIGSNLKVVCEHCGNADCDFDCPDALEWQNVKDAMSSIEKRAELESNRNYNYACDAILSMVLGHAIAGVHVDGTAYLEGLESAIDGIANNI